MSLLASSWGEKIGEMISAVGAMLNKIWPISSNKMKVIVLTTCHGPQVPFVLCSYQLFHDK